MTYDDDDKPPDDWPTDEELADYGYVRRSRRVRLVTSTPRVGQTFWVDFPHDAYAPEFDREHPCVVVRAAQKLDNDTCVVVPLTSTEQKHGLHIHKLEKNPNPKQPKLQSWAVCHHLYTVNVARLRPFRNKSGHPVYPKVSQPDLDGIFAAVRVALHHVYGVPTQPAAAAIVPPAPSVTVVTKKTRGPKKPTIEVKEPLKVGPSGKPVLTLSKVKKPE